VLHPQKSQVGLQKFES